MSTVEPVFAVVRQMLEKEGFAITGLDQDRPWGGFFVIEEGQAEKFAIHFFPGRSFGDLEQLGKLSPKILIVAPGKRLSWQYHHRRAEVWSCIEGPVSVASSDSDTEKYLQVLHPGDEIDLARGLRHRLIGMGNWGVVAEIWQHTDPGHPSDEADIVRLQDDYGR